MSVRRVLSLALVASGGVLANFDWDCLNSLEACNNACYAVNCKSSAYELTYDPDEANSDGRRDDSGTGKNPCTGDTAVQPWSDYGDASDEWPFSKTTEGGKGAILRCVKSSESKSESTQLDSFYKTLESGERFRIGIKNYEGADFCFSNCTNDGGEFHLAGNGKFTAAKKARDTDSAFEAEEADTVVPRGLRAFMGEDGVKRLSLAGPDADLVGMEFWGEGSGFTKIISEIHE